MRLIGTLFNESYARRLSSYLKEKGIDSKCEMNFDPQTNLMSYQVWILDEDKIDTAAAVLERFQKEPTNAEFDPAIALKMEEDEPPPTEEPPTREFAWKKTPFNFGAIIICIAVFFFNTIQEIPMLEEGLQNVFMMTPFQTVLLYDVPKPIAHLEETIEKEAPSHKNLAPQVEKELKDMQEVAYFRGYYDWIILKWQGKNTALAEGPMFVKIRQGEIWRLFSPVLLHASFLHILFNMIWLWVLGKPIEERIGFVKMGMITLISGVGTNTLQYLISGPFFLGYSGIVMTLAGFIWMREKIAPWEGYPVNKTVFLFLFLFIIAMLVLSFASFFLEVFTSGSFSFNIANAAHIAGALIGIVLGRIPYFARKQ